MAIVGVNKGTSINVRIKLAAYPVLQYIYSFGSLNLEVLIILNQLAENVG